MSNKRIHSDCSGLPSSGLLVLLFVGVFLLCHGVFGAMHLFPDPSVSSADRAEVMAMSATMKGVGQGQAVGPMGVDHMGGDNYFAVLLLLAFLGLLLLKNPLSSWLMWRSVTALGASERCFRPFVLHLPRGSPAPLLQVFRL